MLNRLGLLIDGGLQKSGLRASWNRSRLRPTEREAANRRQKKLPVLGSNQPRRGPCESP
jgi:hypothetical protein